MRTTMIDRIIFDLEGTLVDAVDARAVAWCAACEQAGMPMPLMGIRHRLGAHGPELADAILPSFLSPEDRQRIAADAADRFWRTREATVRAFPGVRPLVAALKARDVDVALITDASATVAGWMTRLADVADLVTVIIHADNRGHGKHRRTTVAAAQERLPARDGQLRVVCDDPWTARLALQQGIPCIGVRAGGFERDLLAQGVRDLVDDVTDLASRIDDVLMAAG